uniref:Putative secreted protein n=1 Tax=Ixodes ricinus TaxID=34613 RepID=A0A147BV81_IXORI
MNSGLLLGLSFLLCGSIVGYLKGRWGTSAFEKKRLNCVHLAFRITDIKIIFQCDAPESHKSNFKIGLKPRLPSLGQPKDPSMTSRTATFFRVFSRFTLLAQQKVWVFGFTG